MPLDTDLADKLNYIYYNSLLGYLNTFSDSINYFYNIYIPTNKQIVYTQDDYNSKIYYSKPTSTPTSRPILLNI
jgi:hypothetical protein